MAITAAANECSEATSSSSIEGAAAAVATIDERSEAASSKVTSTTAAALEHELNEISTKEKSIYKNYDPAILTSFNKHLLERRRNKRRIKPPTWHLNKEGLTATTRYVTVSSKDLVTRELKENNNPAKKARVINANMWS